MSNFIFKFSISLIFFLSIRFLDLFLSNDFVIQFLYVSLSTYVYIKIYFEKQQNYSLLFLQSFFLLISLQIWILSYNIISGFSLSIILSNILNTSSLLLIALLSQKKHFLDLYFNLLGLILTLSLFIFIFLPNFSFLFVVGLENGSILEQSNRYCSVFNSPGYLCFFSIALLIYSLQNLFIRFNNKNLLFYLVSLISGLLTINRLFILIFLLSHIIVFLSNFKQIKKILLFCLSVSFIFILVNIFIGNYLNDFYQLFLIRFDKGFENKISGDSGFEYSLKSLYDFSFFFGKIVNVDNELWINNNGNYEQPHNGLIFYSVGYGFFPLFFILMLYLLHFKNLVIFKSKNLYIFTFLILMCSITEIFLIEQINVLLIFSIISLIKNKYKTNEIY